MSKNVYLRNFYQLQVEKYCFLGGGGGEDLALV